MKPNHHDTSRLPARGASCIPYSYNARQHMDALRQLFFVAVCILSAPVRAQDAGRQSPLIEDTEEAACGVLKRTIVRQRNLPTETPTKWEWYCEFSSIENALVRIVALRAGHCDAASCLMGWFAVMRRSSVVLEYDVGEERIVAMPERPTRDRAK